MASPYLGMNLSSIYNFTTIAPGILQLVYTNAKLVSISAYEIAIKTKVVNGLWASIYPYMSNDGVNQYPNDPTAYNYYTFKQESGEIVVLAEPWINASSIKLVSSLSLTISMNGLPDNSDISNIVSILKSSGYVDFTTIANNPGA